MKQLMGLMMSSNEVPADQESQEMMTSEETNEENVPYMFFHPTK